MYRMFVSVQQELGMILRWTKRCIKIACFLYVFVKDVVFVFDEDEYCCVYFWRLQVFVSLFFVGKNHQDCIVDKLDCSTQHYNAAVIALLLYELIISSHDVYIHVFPLPLL